MEEEKDMSQIELTLKNVQTYSLVAGIANAVATILGILAVIGVGVSTFGCGCVFIVFPIISLVVAIIDFIAYSRMNQPPTPQIYSFVKASAVFDCVACFALVPLVMGIMKLQLLGTEEVRQHFYSAPSV
jgi:hypothetical protein